MSKNRLRDTLIDFKQQIVGDKRFGNETSELYYFYCQPKLAKQPPVYVECKPKLYKRACLICLFRASKAVWAHHWED